MSKKNIVIDLSSSDHNQLIKSSSDLIQSEALDALSFQIYKDLIKVRVKNKEQGYQESIEPDDLYPSGSGLTYFVDGTRGAGKSTFLNFMYKNFNKYESENKEKVAVIPLLYLDPSRIESSEVVLLHILKNLKRLMEECPYRTQEWSKRQEEFRDLFKQMAGGLHLFVSNTDSLKDLDAELFLDYGLDRAADSQQLRHLLLKTVDLVCKAYRAEALLLAIDDADTKFANAIEVLECIRKYLDTPQLVVLVTGDMEMYSLLIQNHFQQDFARHNQGFNTDRKTQQSRMVAHLEEQYLLKLFPIQRRVQLKTLHTLTERRRKDDEQPDFIVRTGGDDAEVNLLKAVEEIATEGLRLRGSVDLDLFREHVLKLPVRSVLQLLSTYYHSISGGSISGREAAAEALRATALSSLYQHDIEVESIAEGDLHAVISAAFDLCQLDGEPDTAIYLRPQSRDATLRNAYVSLAADVARLCEHDPAKAITYMVSTAGSNNILHLVMAKASQKTGGRGGDDLFDETVQQRKVKQYLSVGRKDNALNWALHATAALIGMSHVTGLQLRQGIIGVRTSKKGEVRTVDMQLRIARKQVEDDVDSLPPVIQFSQSAVKRPGNTQRYVSIFNTLGLVSNLLDLDTTDNSVLQRQIFKQLTKILSVQTVSLPNWDDSSREKEFDVEEMETENYEDGDSALKNLVSELEHWLDICQGLKGIFHPSAMLMGKIWNRLYFSLDNISSDMRMANHATNRTSKSMELFAWALVNACLVEEVDYHHRKMSDEAVGAVLNRYNPRTSGMVVINKLKEPVNEESPANLNITADIAPLAFMIASCPLVLGLIKRDPKSIQLVDILNAKLKKFRGKYEIPLSVMCDPSVWDIIGQITVSE